MILQLHALGYAPLRNIFKIIKFDVLWCIVSSDFVFD